MSKIPKNLNDFKSLMRIVEVLRGPGGCPWDREQTHRSLAPFAIEEAFELAEAIELGEVNHLVEELGDFLLQVVIHAEIGRQEGSFTMDDVLSSICSKMISRHPHVFSDVSAENSEEVLRQWEQLKGKESKDKGKKPHSSKFGGPVALPALQRAQKIGEKTKRLRFDWSNPHEVLAKVAEEFEELKGALAEKNRERTEAEFGDLLFSVVQFGRHLKVDAEQALRGANRRFEERFGRMQELASQGGETFANIPPEKKEELWQRAKRDLV